jgi:trk system potassium uptake protein TrkA
LKALIVGAGRVGQELLDYLEKNDFYCRVVEPDAKKCESIARKYSAAVFQGSGTDERILEIAGAREVDVLVACTDDDSVNERVARLAKEKFSVPRVVTRVNSMSTDCRKISEFSERVVSQGRLLVDELKRSVATESPSYLYTDEEEGFIVVKLNVPSRSSMIGTAISELSKSCHVCALREGRVVRMDGSTPLMYKDVLIIIGPRDEVESLAGKVMTSA